MAKTAQLPWIEDAALGARCVCPVCRKETMKGSLRQSAKQKVCGKACRDAAYKMSKEGIDPRSDANPIISGIVKPVGRPRKAAQQPAPPVAPKLSASQHNRFRSLQAEAGNPIKHGDLERGCYVLRTGHEVSFDAARKALSSGLAVITPREVYNPADVVRLAKQGLDVVGIAESLGMSDDEAQGAVDYAFAMGLLKGNEGRGNGIATPPAAPGASDEQAQKAEKAKLVLLSRAIVAEADIEELQAALAELEEQYRDGLALLKSNYADEKAVLEARMKHAKQAYSAAQKALEAKP